MLQHNNNICCRHIYIFLFLTAVGLKYKTYNFQINNHSNLWHSRDKHMPAPKRFSLSAEEAILEIATTILVVYFLLPNWLGEKITVNLVSRGVFGLVQW